MEKELQKTKNKYALKVKVKIINRKSEKSIKKEKDFLSQLNHSFLANMICSFQDLENLYLIMDLFQGGHLRYYLCLRKIFTRNKIFYIMSPFISQIPKNIIYRNIKPENFISH